MLFSAAHNLPQFTKTIRTTQTNQTGTFQDPLLSSSPPISISTAPLNAAPYFSPRDEIMRGFEEDEISAGREKSGHVTSQKLNDNSSNNNNTKPSSVNITSNTSATNGATKPNKIGVGGGEKLQDGKYPQLEFARLSVTPRPQTQPPRAEDSVGDQSECDTKNPPASALSLHISSASPSSMGGAAEDSLSLIIYLPSTSPVDIQTSDTATVADVIQIVLQQTMDQGADCTIHNHAPQCYELRLHEGCGEPDEDFPALDRERQIKLFGEGGGGVDEYCLCQIMSVPVPEAPSITSGINSSSSQSQDRCRGLTSSGEVRVKINLPDGGHVVLSMPGDCVCKDLVKNIMTKHKIFPKKLKSSVLLEAQLLENYQFHVTEEDAKRLGHTIDTSVKMETSVKSLFVEELFFRPRHYEDDSLSKKVEPIKGNRADDVSKGPNLDDFMFDEITAGRYKEYKVIKKNKFGRRQERLMGIDAEKIYNSKRTTTGGALSKVYRGERLLTSVKSITRVEREKSYFGDHDQADDYCSFVIEWVEGTPAEEKIVKLEYTAESKEDCAEIVARVQYLCGIGTHHHQHHHTHNA